MPAAGWMTVAALVAISYVYVGRPVAKATKHAAHGVCHVVTLHKKCKS
jgi:hypothetical protein